MKITSLLKLSEVFIKQAVNEDFDTQNESFESDSLDDLDEQTLEEKEIDSLFESGATAVASVTLEQVSKLLQYHNKKSNNIIKGPPNQGEEVVLWNGSKIISSKGNNEKFFTVSYDEKAERELKIAIRLGTTKTNNRIEWTKEQFSIWITRRWGFQDKYEYSLGVEDFDTYEVFNYKINEEGSEIHKDNYYEDSVGEEPIVKMNGKKVSITFKGSKLSFYLDKLDFSN